MKSHKRSNGKVGCGAARISKTVTKKGKAASKVGQIAGKSKL